MTTDGFSEHYQTSGGVQVRRLVDIIDGKRAIEQIACELDDQRGALFTSSYEYPGRYTRWSVGFYNPPLALTARERELVVEPLNERGELLRDVLEPSLRACPAVRELSRHGGALHVRIAEPSGSIQEEQRTREPSVFGALRAVIDTFSYARDPYLGLYGAFGYDLAFQLDPVKRKLRREPWDRDLVLYLPDELVLIDHARASELLVRYEFSAGGRTTEGLSRSGERSPYQPAERAERGCDHEPGEYERIVDEAKLAFARGDLFEVVPGQTFHRPCARLPSQVFVALRHANPAPYGFLINLGQSEYLVGASPEMFVRVSGERVETCPISGTIARGGDALADAQQILKLLNSEKEAAELTMCTDVDRNDKSRVCRPETVRVIGRRQIELYAKLIHTVDHVEGMLREGYDGLDAFVTHTWAVTVTGAPKLWAMQFIEDHEKSARVWYGGAVGKLGFDGSVNTGLTLRTIRILRGVAQVRAGATLLYDSDPGEEERETRLKASAQLEVLDARLSAIPSAPARGHPGAGKRVLLVDHQDSFVHTLAGYFRRTGAEVVTLRSKAAVAELDRLAPDLVVLSPGPGSPSDFGTTHTISAVLERKVPIFGVCLGLQALVEHFGGELGRLGYPMHGKQSAVHVLGGRVLEGLPPRIAAGRYHSLHAVRVPEGFTVTARAEDADVVMAIEHEALPVAAVQFHPESILSAEGEHGLHIIHNVVRWSCASPLEARA